jgi:hypothetical protein
LRELEIEIGCLVFEIGRFVFGIGCLLVEDLEVVVVVARAGASVAVEVCILDMLGILALRLGFARGILLGATGEDGGAYMLDMSELLDLLALILNFARGILDGGAMLVRVVVRCRWWD